MIATNRSFDDVNRCQLVHGGFRCNEPAHPLSELLDGPFCAQHECHALVDAMLASTDDDVTELMPELYIWIERARLEAK